MAILLSAQELGHAFGAGPLFSSVSFTISDGDRVGLIGPNGAGKSTLLKILSGELAPDHGELARRSGLRVAHLAQVPAFTPGATVREAVLDGLPAAARGHWEDEAEVDTLLGRMDLDGPAAGADAPVERLSGGWRKRVALGRALAGKPDLLLLDEPTNHLDVESILWLEALLAEARFSTVTVTHDRLFLQRVARRILELDRRNPGGLFDVAGDYATYVERKADAMAAQEQREQVLRNTLRRETEWLRRGPPARSTKQQARIQRAGSLQSEVADLGARNQVRAVALDFQGRGKQPRRLFEARGLGKSYGERAVFEGIDLFVGPGTRLGLLGPNGCGKSTLLRVLTGGVAPTTGEVLRADDLAVAFFEQDRDALDPTQTVADTVCPRGDFVAFRGARMHRHGYLERFLFRPEQMSQPCARLSGGEQSRLLVAQLMLQPANVLVLDEPTNDLDLPTLAVLEEALTGFDGAVLLVTHDRYFLDQVATKILAFHTMPGEEGRVTSFSDLEQWEAWHLTQQPSRAGRRNSGGPGARAAHSVARAGGKRAPDDGRAAGEPGAGGTGGGAAGGGPGGGAAAGGAAGGGAAGTPARPRKLRFKDQRDWDGIESLIREAEARRAALAAEQQRPEVVSDGVRLTALATELVAASAEIDRLYTRWAELEELRAGVG